MNKLLLIITTGLIALLIVSCGDNSSTVPDLVSPADGAVLDNGRYDTLDEIIWDFDWSDCEGATQYHLYVIGPHATGPIINNDSLINSSYQSVRYGSYIVEKNYYGWTWKVRAKIDGQWGEWSETRTFDIEPINTDPQQTLTTPLTTTQTNISEDDIVVEVELRDGEIWVGSPPEGNHSSLNFKVTNMGTTQHQFVLLYAWDLSPDSLPVQNGQVRDYRYFGEPIRMWFFLALPGPVSSSRGSQPQYKELGPILDPGETVIVTVPYGKPWSNLIIFCNLPGHYESGEYTMYDAKEKETAPIPEDARPINFRDANLESYIREVIGKLEGQIYDSELQTINYLAPRESDIIYLDDLEHCINLLELDLAGNYISDISPLAGLVKLWFLDLSNNDISDISPLVENSGLGEGDNINLQNNNLDPTEGSDDMQNIKTLQDRGVAVIY